MLKSSASLLDSDPRYRDQVVLDAVTGKYRPMCLQDLRDMVAPIELNAGVPSTIREQFDVARNAFVYSWFVYEFATLAEQQGYTTLEMALRHRLDPTALPNTSRSPGLAKILKTATENGWLRRKDFMAPSISGSGDAMCSLDLIPLLRNHVMHGNTQLMPQGTPEVLRLCADILNSLHSAVPGSPNPRLETAHVVLVHMWSLCLSRSTFHARNQ